MQKTQKESFSWPRPPKFIRNAARHYPLWSTWEQPMLSVQYILNDATIQNEYHADGTLKHSVRIPHSPMPFEILYDEY